MKKKIPSDQIKYLAAMAGIKVEDREAESFQKDLNSIFEYLNVLNELDTGKIQPLEVYSETLKVWRNDTPGSLKNRRTILKNAPEKEKNYFKVPKIKES